MEKADFNRFPGKKRVLVAPLNWGLGHATRCIPIIDQLLSLDCEVLIAAEGPVKTLLEKEFPDLRFLPLQGYSIQYSRKKAWLPLKLLTQLPKLVYTIYKEHQWLKQAVKQYGIDGIISDNRFGLYHSTIPSVYITHQLLVKTGNRVTEKIAQKIHYRFIKNYTTCWVPDIESNNNLAGDLSHPLKRPVNVHYIGPLSRFLRKNTVVKKYDILVLISGPEPQRSIFEELIVKQLNDYQGSVLIVRGLPASDSEIPGAYKYALIQDEPGTAIFLKNSGKVVVHAHLEAAVLNDAILQSGIIISRSGYTTVMDLVKLQQKAVLVPTPGQTEQEYLARHLQQQGIFYSVEQDRFVLKDVLAQAEQFPFKFPSPDMELYKKQVSDFIRSL